MGTGPLAPGGIYSVKYLFGALWLCRKWGNEKKFTFRENISGLNRRIYGKRGILM